jgi:hypothetical protein
LKALYVSKSEERFKNVWHNLCIKKLALVYKKIQPSGFCNFWETQYRKRISKCHPSHLFPPPNKVTLATVLFVHLPMDLRSRSRCFIHVLKHQALYIYLSWSLTHMNKESLCFTRLCGPILILNFELGSSALLISSLLLIWIISLWCSQSV